jgi:hypothetical protein
MQIYREVEVYLNEFLISELYEDEWLDLRFGRFAFDETFPIAQWIGGWVL